jgi:hypothetical protein
VSVAKTKLELEETFRAEEAIKVHDWRAKVCRDLGFSDASAERIAGSDADLHELADMIAQGCTRTLAKRIVL